MGHHVSIKVNMKKRSLSLLATLTVLTLACNTLTGLMPTPTPPAILHFENDFVAFDYPDGMKIFNTADPAFTPYPENVMGGQLVAALADPQEIDKKGYFRRTVSIFRHSNPSTSNLEQFMEIAYLPVHNIKVAHIEWIVDASGPATLGELPAFQQTYRYLSSSETPPYEMRDIWVEKDGLIFRVSVWNINTYPEVFAAFQSLADKIVNSLVIKDNLPPILETPTPEPIPSPTPFPTSMIAHFENDVVAFDYLKGMTLYSNNNPAFVIYPDIDFGGETVVGLGDSLFFDFGTYFRSIRITRLAIPPGSNLEVIYFETYRKAETKFPQETGILNADGLVDVNGWTGRQKTYRVYSGESAYELRDIWIQKDDEIIIIAIWTEYTNPDDFAAFQGGADILLNSLQIK
jgi:hypothetical protein